MVDLKPCTDDKILSAAIELMDRDGFKAVTIKDIATSAKVSEMTIFRHFSTKNALLEEAIRKHSYVLPFRQLFRDEIVWDLESDLLMVSLKYQELMEKNRTVVAVAIEERNTTTIFKERISENPKQLKQSLIAYFKKMQDLSKMACVDVEAVAVTFVHMNFGIFMSTLIHGNYMTDMDADAYIRFSVRAFVHGLLP
jgi:AcrR family transcriptional regulator